MSLLLEEVKDDTAGELAGNHAVVDRLEVVEGLNLDGALDVAGGGDLEGLVGVLAVADVRRSEGLVGGNGPEDVGLDVGTLLGETDSDDGAGGADVLHGDQVSLGHGGGDDGGLGTEAVRGGGLDSGDNVLGLLEVDPGAGAELLAERLLLSTSVDGNGGKTHVLGVLEGEGAETTTGTGDGDPLAGLDVGALESLVNGNTGAEDGGGLLEGDVVGDLGELRGVGRAAGPCQHQKAEVDLADRGVGM